ncbi:MAG: helix-turn-helix domain-containing protein [Planctomycetota bacterium]
MSQSVRVVLVLGRTADVIRRGIFQAVRPQLPWHFLPLTLDDPHWPDKARHWRLDAAIVQIRSPRVLRQALSLSKPVVDLMGRGEAHDLPRIGPSVEDMAREVIQHLRDCGYPTGAFYGPRDGANADARWQAFKRLAAEQHWPVQRLDVTRIQPDPDDPPGIGFYGEEAEVIAWLRRQQQSVGVWCANDTWAFNLAETCHFLQIPVPDHIGICGTGDDPDRCLAAYPSLSSLYLPYLEVGAQAVHCLQALLAGEPAPSLSSPPLRIHARNATDRWASDDPLLRDMVELIRDRACHGIGPDGLARSLGTGRRSLENRCRSAFGCSPFRLIRRQRLHTAMQLLRDSELPIGEVASRCGWSTPARFSSEFSAATGSAPSDWRRQYAER